MARPTSAVPQLTKDDVRFCERAMAGLATAKTDSSGDADGLLKYGYHQNPYMRTFVKVLWSGYAISRNQLADGSQRFSQARRDATVSAIDQLTTKSLDDAAKALEGAMSPSGSLGTFLTELRERTMPRLWSRVCETAGLPPPSFHAIYGKARKVSHDDLDAEEEAELEALRKAPAEVPEASEEEDEEGVEFDDDLEEGGSEAQEGEAEPVESTQPRERAPRAERPERAERAPRAEPAGPGEAAPLTLTVTRSGGVDLAAELLMSAVSEVLRELRTRQASGSLKFSIQVEGQRAGSTSGSTSRGERSGDRPRGEAGGEKGEGNGQRRRRRRR